MSSVSLPPLRPIPIKERLSILYIERGQLDVLDGAFVVDKNGVRTHIQVGGRGHIGAVFPAGAGDEPSVPLSEDRTKFVFPAGAGMNRTRRAREAPWSRVPRRRGHGRVFLAGAGMNRTWKRPWSASRWCSPQARG